MITTWLKKEKTTSTPSSTLTKTAIFPIAAYPEWVPENTGSVRHQGRQNKGAKSTVYTVYHSLEDPQCILAY